MTTTLTIKGQVTIPKKIRDALDLQPGCKINFAVNDSGDVLLQKVDLNQSVVTRKKSSQSVPKDRFEKVRGRADIQWRTQDLMNLLRGEH
jgi:antitoxin PrlF